MHQHKIQFSQTLWVFCVVEIATKLSCFFFLGHTNLKSFMTSCKRTDKLEKPIIICNFFLNFIIFILHKVHRSFYVVMVYQAGILQTICKICISNRHFVCTLIKSFASLKCHLKCPPIFLTLLMSSFSCHLVDVVRLKVSALAYIKFSVLKNMQMLFFPSILSCC